MCGITGWISRKLSAPVDGRVLARMRDAVATRSPGVPARARPDDEGPRGAVRGMIPDEIIDRPKICFGAPMRDFSLPVWTFSNAVAWFDRWVDGRREARVA